MGSHRLGREAGRRRLIRRPIVACAILAAFGAQAEPCAPDRIEIHTANGPVVFSVEVADNDDTRARGLMYREEMAADAGMFFVYPRAEQVTFWMKNTPLSLDIVFLNRKGVVCSIAAGTTPFSTDHIPSGCAAQTVLEINAGEAEARGIKRGAAARHPAIRAPVWTCE